MQDKIREIMGLADAYAHHERMQDAWAAEQCRELIESKLRELLREPLSMDDANKLWDDCLKKYKRPGPYELIVEFCKVTSASGEV